MHMHESCKGESYMTHPCMHSHPSLPKYSHPLGPLHVWIARRVVAYAYSYGYATLRYGRA